MLRNLKTPLCGLTLAFLAVGCSDRVLTIEVDDYINTAMHQDRTDTKTGSPLSIDVVCVTPADLAKDENQELLPVRDKIIDSKQWFDKRPTRDSFTGNDKSKFVIPRNQIYVLSDDKALREWGTPIPRVGSIDGGKYLKKTGKKANTVDVGGIKFRKDLFNDEKSVIYVFPRFTVKGGGVLPSLPAIFDPPGAYPANIKVKIGVNSNSSTPPCYGQYIENVTERWKARFGESALREDDAKCR